MRGRDVIMGILTQLSKGEGKTVEFKEDLPLSDQIAKTVVAFANTAGGKIFIGVKDDGTVCGVDNKILLDRIEAIANMLHDKISPFILPDIYSYAVEDKNIIVVEVFQSQLKPHFLKNKGKLDGTYLRVGSTNKKADENYIQDLGRSRLNLSYDEDICLTSDCNAEILLELKSLLTVYLGRTIAEEQLLNLKLLKVQNGQTYLTNAAIILLGKKEFINIKCARFKNDDSAIFIDRKEFSGNLFYQLEESMKFLLNHINLEGQIGPDNLKRVDKYEIPPVALREALINAIVHRDYLMSGSDIKIAVYDSKVEITSPGTFPKGITLDEIISGRSEIRNRVIARVFKEAELIEQWGRGIQQIYKLCLDNGLLKPDIIESGMFVQLRFYRKDYNLNNKIEHLSGGRKKRTKKVDEKSGRKHQYDVILNYIIENNKVTTATAMELLNLGKSRVVVILSEMIEKRLIKRVGQGRATYYTK